MFQGTRKKQKRTVIVMANTAQKLRKTRVRNNTELRTLKSRNCYATDDATAAQKDTLKASAIAVLRRNKERNRYRNDAQQSTQQSAKSCV
jgi:hypothetical protein